MLNKDSGHQTRNAAFVAFVLVFFIVPALGQTSVASLIFPPNGATNVDPLATLTWNSISNAQTYYVYVGSAPGLKDIYGSGEISSTSLVVPNLQANTHYYIRLFTEINSAWLYTDSAFTTGTGIAHLLTPVNGASDVDPLATLTWNSIPNAQTYYVYVGSVPGLKDIYGSGEISSTSLIVPNLQANTHYHIRLFTEINGAWLYTDSAFTTGTGIAHLTSPADGAIDIDPFTKLSWNAVSDAQAYYIYVGSALGLQDIYGSSEIPATSLGVPGLKTNTHYYIRLWTKKNSNDWYFTDSAFTTGNGFARMTYPVDQATNVDPGLPFTWSIVPQALSYRLYVGVGPGMNDIWDSGDTTDTSKMVPVHNPGTYYLRLFTADSYGSHYIDSSFTLGDFVAHLITPPNQGVADPFASFTWTTVPNADKYYLYVGTTQGAKDIFGSGETTATSVFVPNLAAGTKYFARMWTYRDGGWYYGDSTFIAGNGPSVLADPTTGAAITPFHTFSWNPPDGGADGYELIIGTSAGARDIFDSGQLRATSIMPARLDFGKTYYATLFTLKSSIWLSTSSTFTTLDQASTPNLGQLRSSFYSSIEKATGAVRLMDDPATNVLVPGSLLESIVKQYGATAPNCVHFSLALEAELLQSGVASRSRFITLTGDSWESHTTVEYYDPFLQKWAVADATFGVMYFDPPAQAGQSVEDLQALVFANDFADIHFQYATTYGDSILRAYYMDPITLYLNVAPVGQGYVVLHSPLQFLDLVPLQNAVGTANTYVFEFADISDQLQATIFDTSVTITTVDGTLFSKAIGTSDGWTLDVAPTGLTAYTFVRPMF